MRWQYITSGDIRRDHLELVPNTGSMGPFFITLSNSAHQLSDQTHRKLKNLDLTQPNPM